MIAALEPDPSNYRIASQNLLPYGDRVQLLNVALGGRAGRAFVSGATEGAHVATAGTPVEVVTVPDVMRRMGWDTLDVLKMDIEGAELDLFRDLRVEGLKRIVLEVHPHKIGKAGMIEIFSGLCAEGFAYNAALSEGPVVCFEAVGDSESSEAELFTRFA